MKSAIVYNMIGNFDSGAIKDLLTPDGKSRVCIQEDLNVTTREAEPELAHDGWFDAKVSTIDEYTVKAVLAKIHDVALDQIQIVHLPVPPSTTAYANA